MAENYKRWGPEHRASAYRELEHPTDLFLEIHGRDPRELIENALFAFYDQISELEGFEPRRELTLEASGGRLEDALRALLSEALFYFDTEGFVGVGGEVTVEDGIEGTGSRAASTSPVACAGSGWRLWARVWGENADRKRHTLHHEVKAVTYHRLAVERSADGFTATVLLDL
jgi:SHS2 domain-containing protein